jgi:hypothetical protein
VDEGEERDQKEEGKEDTGKDEGEGKHGGNGNIEAGGGAV